jgi:DNA-binding protein H-NS
MRKPRDYDAELKALNERAKQLKERKVHQLGELVIATGADVLSIEELAGLLLASVERPDAARKESWRKRGADFFQRGTANAADNTRRDNAGTATSDGGTLPLASQPRQN